MGKHTERQEWIEVAVEVAEGGGVNEAEEDALDKADAEFKRLHPAAELAG